MSLFPLFFAVRVKYLFEDFDFNVDYLVNKFLIFCHWIQIFILTDYMNIIFWMSKGTKNEHRNIEVVYLGCFCRKWRAKL